MKNGIAKTVFFRLILLLLSFWEASQGTEQNRTVRVRAWIKRKKDGNVDGERERKGRADLLEILATISQDFQNKGDNNFPLGK